MAHKHYSKQEISEALSVLRTGATVSEVAALVGASDNTVRRWRRRDLKNGTPEKKINPLLQQLAAGNDLSRFVGRDITTMQPREIWDFLRAINVKGTIITQQSISL